MLVLAVNEWEWWPSRSWTTLPLTPPSPISGVACASFGSCMGRIRGSPLAITSSRKVEVTWLGPPHDHQSLRVVRYEQPHRPLWTSTIRLHDLHVRRLLGDGADADRYALSDSFRGGEGG